MVFSNINISETTNIYLNPDIALLIGKDLEKNNAFYLIQPQFHIFHLLLYIPVSMHTS
jgi:hypothetical protein